MGSDQAQTGNPVSLYLGEKREEITDLSLNSPAGPLTFTRAYRQNKRTDANYQFMGLGWTHNHNLSLSLISGSPNQIVVRMANGGEPRFVETTSGHYEGVAGINSTIDWNGSQYTLTAVDKTLLVFSSAGKLLSRTWPSGEVWTYTHTAGKLSAVDDGYGRQLQFSYINNPSQYDDGQLWRVGDHSASGLAGGSPTGRYVEFGYTPQKSNGVTISNPKALLASVRDVRGSNWIYSYYGQLSGETNTNQLDFITQRQSPSVDTTGDGVADQPITLEKLGYTLSGATLTALTQQRGVPGAGTPLLETTFNFQPGGQNITTEVTAGKTTTHFFNGSVHIGTQDPAGQGNVNLLNGQYRPDVVTDPNGNPTELDWSAQGKLLSRVKDALKNETTFHYNIGGASADMLDHSLDAEGRKTKYVYGDTTNPRLPTEVKVFNNAGETTLLAWQRFAYDNRGRTLLETTLDATDSAIESAFERTSSGTGSWQTLTASYTPSANAPQRRLQFVAVGALAEFYVDSVSILENGTTELAVNGGMEADSGWPAIGGVTLEINERSTAQVDSGTYARRVKASAGLGIEGNAWHLVTGRSYTITVRVYVVSGVARMRVVKPQAQVGRSYYTSGNGNGLLQTVTQQDLDGADSRTTTYFYDTFGRVVQTNQNTTFGSCTSSYSVFDEAGNVVASICNYDPGMGSAPTTVTQAVALFNPSFPDKNRVTTHEYDTLGRRVKTTTDAGASYAQTSLTAYDGLDRVVRTIANYVADAGVPHPYTAAHSAFSHGTDNTQNLVTDTAYNARGLVRRLVDVLGNVTLFGYDDAGRLIKTVASASVPTYNNDYTGTGADPALASYTPSSAPDLDLITTSQYDAAGNLVKTVDTLGNVNFTVYDALNRPVKAVRNAKDTATIALNPGDGGYSATNDPRSASYIPDSAADRDLIDLTEYDALGRVRRTQDVNGTWTLFGYDALGRQVKVIRSASMPTYDLAADPTLASYTPSSAADEDIVSQTTYDGTGRVLYTTDVLNQRAWQAYDGLNRVVKTIANAVGTATDGGTNDPRSSGYTPSTDSDKDLVTLTHYDSDGRVQWTQDKLGRKTWQVYDDLGRLKKTIVNCTYTSGTPAPEDATYTGSSDSDKDIITRTTYDARGWVAATFDPLGREIRFEYDVLGRRTKTTVNYVDGIYNSSSPDEDLITTTVYDLAGRVTATTDPRGTQTTFTYDAAGRQLTVTRAAGTALAVIGYTCYDKAGRVLRTIQNWVDSGTSPDARDGSGNYLFNPSSHGTDNDQNLITTYTLDRLGRQTAVANPLNQSTSFSYFKDGQLASMTDALGVVTQHRYDKLRRRTLAVTSYQANGEDPALWVWDTGDNRWEKSNGTAIAHGTANDQNVIVQVTYDKAGRQVNLRDPRGKLTQYTYDLLSRRISLTNPLSHVWATAYTDPGSGTTRITLTDPLSFQTRHDFDQAGRLATLDYLSESPKLTPDVTFTYDKRGSRTLMSESDGSSTIRRTVYSYDNVQRLLSVGFDTDGNGTVDQTVSYDYDAAGLRTKLTLPGSLDVVYEHTARGELKKLTDWSSQVTDFTYDGVSRLKTVERSNGLDSAYSYDAASRLTALSHVAGSTTIASFAYTVNALGNRTGVVETQAQAPSGSDTHNLTYNYDALSRLTQAIHRADGTLGSGTVQRQFDYAYDLAGNRTQQVVTISGTPTTTNYTYDAANRISSDGTNTFTYDNAGRLTSDGVNAYTWDRANRLLTYNGTAYQYGYDGDGRRVKQSVSGTVTQYLLNVQPQLAQIVGATTGANTIRYVHDLTGIHSEQNADTSWHWMVKDGLGSVRAVVNNIPAVLHTTQLSPYGEPFGPTGTSQTVFGFTGEPTDGDGLVHLRARYYNPALGVFPSLDPLEGVSCAPMTLNRFSYVQGNVPNATDPSGLCTAFVGACALALASPFDAIAGDIIACGSALLCVGSILVLARELGKILGQNADDVERLLRDLSASSTVKPPSLPFPGNPTDADILRYYAYLVGANAAAHVLANSHSNDPRCTDLCGTQAAVYSATNFGGKVAPEVDMLCHLACNKGAPEAAAATGLILVKSMGMNVLPNPNGRFNGYFVEAGRKLQSLESVGVAPPPGVTIDVPNLYDDDAVRANDLYNLDGGLIMVRQPRSSLFSENRAARLGTLVEEIGHALLYHSPLCPYLTPRDDERAAKLFKRNWVGRSGLNIVTDYSFQGVSSKGRRYKTCPSEPPSNTTSSGNNFSVAFIVASQPCMDTNIISSLLSG